MPRAGARSRIRCLTVKASRSLYSAIRLADDGSGPGGARIIAFGRDMRAMVSLQQGLVEAQQTMEQDYWRFREAETRFRHLFETSSDALLVVDGVSLKVLEANPAARSLCAPARTKLIGSTLASLVEPGHGERLQDLLAAARSVGRQDPLRTRLAGDGREVLLSASVFRQEQSAFLMVRFAPARPRPVRRCRAAPAGGRRRRGAGGRLGGDPARLREQLPDGMVFCEPSGKLVAANRAFLALTQLAAEEQARGQPHGPLGWVVRAWTSACCIGNLRQRGHDPGCSRPRCAASTARRPRSRSPEPR
jgi:transcriptional regulator PpsR